MSLQRTIHKPAACTGIGLHSGRRVSIYLHPAPVDHGIEFVGRNGTRRSVKVSPEVVVGSDHNTSLGENGWQVRTVEHLLATLHALGIDNLIIEVEGSEIPIMDGSAAPFIHLIQLAGVKDLPKPKKYIKVTKTVTVSDGERSVTLQPAPNPKISFSLQFDHPAIGSQIRTFELTPAAFTREIASARTFGFVHELETLQERGLARGASLENAVAIDRYRVVNQEGLRYQDEFVRHKILDALGDLFLVGEPIIGHYKGVKAGHRLNFQLISALLSRPDAWKEIEGKDHRVAAAVEA